MSRPLRIDYPFAFHHVMNRGANHAPIFLGSADRRQFVQTLAEAVDRWKINIHAYSLMPNHYHLLMETPHANLSRALRHIDGLYTQKFNKTHGRDGPLFRGRFKSILVDKEGYLLELIRYIHLNGVRAGIYKEPSADLHCSHKNYLSPGNSVPWLTTRTVLSQFSNDEVQARKLLDEFVLQGVPRQIDDILNNEKWPAILGSDSFSTMVRDNRLRSLEPNRDLPQKRSILEITAVPPDIIIEAVADISRDIGKKYGSKFTQEIKWVTIYGLNRLSMLTLKEVGHHMELTYKAVSAFFRRHDFTSSNSLKRMIELVAEKMEKVAT